MNKKYIYLMHIPDTNLFVIHTNQHKASLERHFLKDHLPFFFFLLPMISPTLFFTTIVATISSFQVFETVNLMTQGGPVNSTNTLVYQIYSDAFKYLKLGPATAEAVVLLALVGILTILYFVFLGRKVHYQ